MYKIIGNDQQEYGPVDAALLQQWIAERRVNASTQVLAEGASEWKTLSELPEFSDALAATMPAPGLKLTQQPGPAMPAPLPRMAYAPVATGPAKTSALAVWSLVCAILGPFSCGIGSLLGLIFGIIALMRISQSRGQLQGKGLAIAGLCVAGMLAVLPFMMGLTLPAFGKAKAKAQRINCVTQMKQLGLAVRMYANANQNKLPSADKWCDDIQPYVNAPKVFCCPSAAGQRCTYAFNAKLSGRDLTQVSPETVLFFEIDGGWNMSGGPEQMISAERHAGYNVGFVDGSVQQLSQMRLQTLRWDP